MWLCFLLEKQHVPYIKWFGTAFEQLKIAPWLSPILLGTLSAANWSERERQLCTAYEIIAQAHNALNITQPGPTQVSNFHDRPFKVIQAEAFAYLTRAAITDPEVLALPPHIGASDQFVDSTDVLSDPIYIDRLKAIFV